MFIIFRVVVEHGQPLTNTALYRCIEFVNSRGYQENQQQSASTCLHLIAHAFFPSSSPPSPLPDFSSSFFLAMKKRRFPGRRPNSTTLFFPFHIPRGQNLSCLNEMQSISRFFLPFLFVRAVFGMRSIRGRAFKRGGGGGGGGRGLTSRKDRFRSHRENPPLCYPPSPRPLLNSIYARC